ncbi:hypothetical protein CC78DRAFT_511594 [Lojkania enalia]|uniref:Uncharacterized protein n=1 Tax=Lojkania enalia TaxID=147567 RepID=A0A9P4KGR6_9PLEO|nr:hypothetical protein CC78DRAFT_511594 [Didymosphaeria enalia]
MRDKGTPEQQAANQQRKAEIEERSVFLEPPPYSPQSPVISRASSVITKTEHTVQASPVLQHLDFTPSPLELPTAIECIAHLKLLHAFAKLRHEIGNREGLFGIDIGAKPDLAERIREKRWTVFVTKAVDRFAIWWETLPKTSHLFPMPIRTSDFESMKPTRFPEEGDGMGDNIISALPPLDVLMVWHAYMLNPRLYLEDCMRMNKHKIWHTPFPWETIYSAIDDATFTYSPPETAITTWGKSTYLPWNSLDDENLKSLTCPKCTRAITVPWTAPATTGGSEALESYLSRDIGFAGENFQGICPACGLLITHEKLRVGKFIDDVHAMCLYSRPMLGTILATNGVPPMTSSGKKISTHDPFFPNRIVQTLYEFRPITLRSNIEKLSIPVLKSRFQGVMISPSQVKAVNSGQYKQDFVAKESKIAVRKMLSHYWDNSSPFGLDLVGAILRQGSFVQKMRKIDWLHSPAAMSTMQRLIVKYHRFVRIIAENPKRIAVPTLDIDLAWHTHQLTPRIYFRYTVSETKKFLNHDDKIPEFSLHNSFQWTSTAYEKKYGQPYSECACWYCECTREPLRSSFTNRINPLRSPKAYDVDNVSETLPKDVVTGPHVSAHNAVKMEGHTTMFAPQGTWAQHRRREFEELDLRYAKVCKRYQKKKKGDETPSRDNDAYIYGAYGYPMYYPVFIPYYAEPTSEGDRYTTVNGGGGGGCGGCAAGTCSGGATLGSCAGGVGTPGCKASCGGHGDASGGCGTCGGGGGGCGGCGGG